jgi:hypothetical protein
MKTELDEWDEFAEAAAKILQEEIDREIVDSMIVEDCKQNGWTGVPVNAVSPIDMSEWVHLNATGDYRFAAQTWWFENAIDATNFALKWA